MSAIVALVFARQVIAADGLFFSSAEAEGVAVMVDTIAVDLDVSVSLDQAQATSPLSGNVITTTSDGYGAYASLLDLMLIPATTMTTTPPGGTDIDQNLSVNAPLTGLGITGNISTVNGLSTADAISTQSVHSSTATVDVGVTSVLDLGVGGVFNNVDSSYAAGQITNDAEAVLAGVALEALLGASVLSADVIQSNASCVSDGSGGAADIINTSSTFAGLTIAGIPTTTVAFPPNTSISVPGVATITFNKVVTEAFGSVISGTVSAVAVEVNLVVGSATVELARSNVICDVPGVLAVSMNGSDVTNSAQTPLLMISFAAVVGLTLVAIKRKRVHNSWTQL